MAKPNQTNKGNRKSTRRTMLKNVSNIGSPRASAGSARPTNVSDLAVHITLAEARKKPTNNVPQSPMNTLAGLKLKNRKPVRLPSNASMSTDITIWPV